jgi:hypothetical protein
MPFVTGLIFLPPLLLFVWMLSRIPPPRAEDVLSRSARTPMQYADRKRLFAIHAFGLSLLVITYAMLTIMRSIRDDFAVEIWRDLGQSGKPMIFAYVETVVMLGVVGICGAAILIRDNRRALQTALLTILAGFVLVALAAGTFVQGWLSGFAFMVLTGVGMYVPYVAFHTTLFERIIAVFRNKGNMVYLMYLADAFGYLGYVVVMLFHTFSQAHADYLAFYVRTCFLICAASVVLMVLCAVYFQRKMARLPSPQSPGPEKLVSVATPPVGSNG